MSVQQSVINQLKTSLETLVTQGKLKAVYTDPVGLNQAPEYPFAFFRLGSDESYENQVTGGGIYLARGVVNVVMITGTADEYAAKDLADLVDEVRRRLIADRSSFTNISLRSLRQNDPRVSDLFNEFAVATISVGYEGVDNYT